MEFLFLSQLLKQTAFTFKRFVQKFSPKKGKHFVTTFLNAITTSATVAIAAAFENASKRGYKYFSNFPERFC